MRCDQIGEQRCPAAVETADEHETVTRRAETHPVADATGGVEAPVELPLVPARPLRVLGIADARSINNARWARRLVDRGHEVHLVSDRLPAADAPIEGATVHDVRALGSLMR